MKKTLFLLLLSVATYGQATFDEGIQLSGNQKTTTAPRVILQETDGVLNYQDTEVFSGNSSGAISGFAITDNGNGTANIASGQALLRATNSETGVLQKYTIPAVTNLTLTDNANNYVLANYNGGNPTLTVTTDPTQINGKTTTIVYVIARVGNTLHYLNLAGANVDSNGKLRARFLNTEAIKRAQGMALGFANRNISVTAGLSYSGLIPIQTTAFNTATGSTFTNFYGTTRQAGQTQINNTQYNNAGVLTAMPNNSFRTDYVYVLANNPSKLYTVMGGTSATLTVARAVGAPSVLPVELQYLGVLVGRTIIAKDATTITEVSSAFETVFANNGVTNYNDLANLPTIDQTLIDGSSNAVSNNAVVDGLVGKFNTPTGLTTNYLPKWNGSGFGNSTWQEIGGRLTNGSDNLTDALQVNGSGRFNGPLGVNYGNDFKMWDFSGSGFANMSYNQDVDLIYFNRGLQVNGNITASPAVAPNQVVVKSQLDAFVPSGITLQSVYDNGASPIMIANGTRGAFILKSNISPGTEDVFKIRFTNDTETFSIKGNGMIDLKSAGSGVTFSTTSAYGGASLPTAVNKDNLFTIFGSTSSGTPSQKGGVSFDLSLNNSTIRVLKVPAQSGTLALTNNPTFTGSVVVPNAVNANEAVNKGQLDAVATGATYTPTLTTTGNTTSISLISALYTVNGSVISVRIDGQLNVTAANIFSGVQVTLPFPFSSTTTQTNIGNGCVLNGAGYIPAIVQKNSNFAHIYFTPTFTGTNLSFSATFTYLRQ